MLLTVAISAGTVLAGGLNFTGDRLDKAQLTFDGSKADLSSPKATVKSFLELMVGAEMIEMDIKMVENKTVLGLLAPVFTEKGIQSLRYSQRQKEGESIVKVKNTLKTSLDINSMNVEDKDGGKLVTYDVKMSFQMNCFYCATKGTKDCRRCENGVLKKDRGMKGQMLLKQEGDKWKIASMYKACYSCDGGKCKRCAKKNPAKAEKQRKCYNCGDTGKCRRCKGTGLREDTEFKRGPRGYTGLPSLDPVTGADLSSPEKAFEAVSKVMVQVRACSSYDDVVLGKAIASLRDFFFVKGYGSDKKRTRPYKSPTFKLVSVDKKENEAVITYSKTAYGRAQNHQMVLSKDDSGRWKVTELRRGCYRCRRVSKKGAMKKPGRECRSCRGKGFNHSRYIP